MIYKKGAEMKRTNMILLLFIPFVLMAHGGEKHTKVKTETLNKSAKTEQVVDINSTIASINKQINEKYIQDVKPIFEKKCFDCHGSISKYPWYYKVPGVKQMIDYDMKEAKKHLDMSEGFPFKSHGTPFEDAKSIKKVAKEGSMPPLRYVLGHWNSTLSEDEKQKIIRWSEESLSKLKGASDE